MRRGERKPRSKREALGADIDRAEDWAEQETAKAEHADDLFKSLVSGQVDPGTIAGDIDALLDWIARMDEAGRFSSVVSVGRRVSRLLALAQRWIDLVRSLHEAKDAAERLKDSHTVAWATHELGTLHLCADDPDEASRLLQHARKMRMDLGDRPGLATTEHNLQVLCGRVQQLIRDRRLRRRVEYLRSPLVIALAAALLGGGVAAGAVVTGNQSKSVAGTARGNGRHIPALKFAASAPPSGTVGRGYDFHYSTTGASGIAYAVTAGSAPPGLSLSSAGRLSGTPTTQGTFTFTVTATGRDGATVSRQDSVSIAAKQAPAIRLTSGAPPAGTVGQPYTFTYATSGDSGVIYLATAAGTPPGLSLSLGGVLAGTPTTSGRYTFTVTATGSGGGRESRQDTIQIAPKPVAKITFTSGEPPSGTVDHSYSFTYTASGDSGITYSYQGSLPPGLSLSATGMLSGTPSAPGAYTFTVSATGASGAATAQQSTINIVATPPPPPLPPPPPTSTPKTASTPLIK